MNINRMNSILYYNSILNNEGRSEFGHLFVLYLQFIENTKDNKYTVFVVYLQLYLVTVLISNVASAMVVYSTYFTHTYSTHTHPHTHIQYTHIIHTLLLHK